MILLQSFIRNGFCPSMVRNGRKIILMEVKDLGIRFLRSNSYFDYNEYELAKLFDIEFNQVFFPCKFSDINFDYVGPVPDINYFCSALDSETMLKYKFDYVKELSSQNYKWDIKRELLQLAEQKLLLLTLSCLKFINNCYEFQRDLTISENFIFLHPFSFPLCSLGGYIYKLYKVRFLNNFDIYVVNHEFGKNSKNVSKSEQEWVSYMEFLYPEENYLSAFNNSKGQKYFKETVPDLYSPISKKAYFFNGCVFHGHYENCLKNPNACEDTKNPFGKTYKELNELFELKATSLIVNNPDDINEVTIFWECQFQQLRNQNSFQRFLESYVPHPLIRLNPRSCVRGAFFDVFAFQWSKKLFPNETLYFLDINGLYSYCAIQYRYMTGKYIELIGKDLKLLECKNNRFFFQNINIMGSILLTILPPRDLLFPFLLYRLKNGKTINTLCATCAEKNTSKCNHSETERALTACYMFSEIEFALSLNYRILAIHECHIYTSSDYILKDFVKILNFFKTKNSDALKSCVTSAAKQIQCDYLNNELELCEPFLLSPSNITPNQQRRTFFKLCANALFGKLEQRNDKCKTLFVNKSAELEAIFYSENEIKDIFCMSEEICQIQVSPNVNKLPPNRKNNCYIGAQVTAYARQVIFSHLLTLYQNQANIYQVDCDSIIFSLNNELEMPFKLSEIVGAFKSEIQGQILSFYSLGPKNYSITYEAENSLEVNTISRIRGLSLNNSLNNVSFNDELFKKYVEEFLQQKSKKVSVKQFRKRANFKKLKISSKLEAITFSNSLSQRRIINLASLNLSSIPYGYKLN